MYLCALSCFGPVHVQLCNDMYCSLPACSVLGILQARILEWVAMPRNPPPGDLSDPGIKPASLMSHALASEFFITIPTWQLRPLCRRMIRKELVLNLISKNEFSSILAEKRPTFEFN